MSRFLDPPKAGKPLAEDKVDKTYKAMRTKVFLGAFFGYAAYYLVRKNLSLAAPDMIHDGIIDAGKAGLAMSAVSIAYAFSKFIMGSVSDRSDAQEVPLRRPCPFGSHYDLDRPYPVRGQHRGEHRHHIHTYADSRLAERFRLASLRQNYGALVQPERTKLQDERVECIAHHRQLLPWIPCHRRCDDL